MTRQFNQQIHCPNCKAWITYETSFGRWIRNNPEIDSGKGYGVVDQDYWIHKFKTFAGRKFQCIMLVEIKTMGGKLTASQYDILHIVNQVMRNRRKTPTKELKYQHDSTITEVYSTYIQEDVFLKLFGMHILTFQGLGPDDSEWIYWDNKYKIDVEVLTQLLRFDLDPDTLKPLDLRSHHKKIKKTGPLYDLIKKEASNDTS